MNLLVLTGAPGAGKGTQADLLVENLGFHKISTGDALRRQISLGSEIGKQASGFMEKGQLVPDDVLLKILKAELEDGSGEKVLLDGYPRNLAQAETLETLSDQYPVKLAIHLDVDQTLLKSRICGRRVCSSCGSPYHLQYNPPKVDGVCDKCGKGLVQRPDDSEDKVAVRLDVYRRETEAVLEYYRERNKCVSIDGSGATDVVYNRLVDVVSGL